MDSKPTSKHIFISYSHADAQMMSQIRSELESMGIRAWTDEGLIPGTESWKTTIEANIRDALGIIVILSPSANQSVWVERELEYASVHGVRIFPVLVQGEPREAIPIELINAQWIDVRDEASFSAQIQKLVRALLAKPDMSKDVPDYPRPGYPKIQPKQSKSTKNLLIFFSVIIGICLVCATTLTILFGPTIIDSISSDSATSTKVLVPSTTNAPTDLPTPTPTQTPISKYGWAVYFEQEMDEYYWKPGMNSYQLIVNCPDVEYLGDVDRRFEFSVDENAQLFPNTIVKFGFNGISSPYKGEPKLSAINPKQKTKIFFGYVNISLEQAQQAADECQVKAIINDNGALQLSPVGPIPGE